MPTLYLPCDSLARAVGADEVSVALITQAKERNLPLELQRTSSRGLYWLAMQELRAAGVRELNLGGGIHPGDGLSEFKQRLGAQRSPTIALKQVFDQARYDAACVAVGVEPTLDGYFPAWRRRPA